MGKWQTESHLGLNLSTSFFVPTELLVCEVNQLTAHDCGQNVQAI